MFPFVSPLNNLVKNAKDSIVAGVGHMQQQHL